ncbi:unnamed protein product [Timema podura]|uniref:Coatomer subunit delta n=1 Tax=Timema podura TaxID=61482 RepID=A0ABN7NS90_TIMPD|nr:unnamed protein product [Timema podura]
MLFYFWKQKRRRWNAVSTLLHTPVLLNYTSLFTHTVLIGSSPVVSECDGEYTYEPRKNMLLWTLPIIDASNKSGAMEFSATALPGDFFPVTVNFVCKRSYANLKVTEVLAVEDDSPVKFSEETVFFTEKYEVV